MSTLVFLGTGAGGFRGSSRQKSSFYLDGMLFDCGAGTCGRLEDLGLLDKVDAIFISHLHSDHVSGLYDVLVAMVVDRRKRPVHICSPPGLSDVLKLYTALGNKLSDSTQGFELKIKESTSPVLNIGNTKVRGFLLNHVVPNVGYLVENKEYTLFYTGDTAFPWSAPIEKVDYLIHEATFTHQFLDFAKKYGHSTAKEAAQAALKLNAKRLFLFHVNNRSSTPEEKHREAKEIFAESVLPQDLQSFNL
ncbi:hypothetical protein B9Q00_07145 [Candidatus Marsarchaeota G1 archaeon OSP_C]|jgi:Metal-dependent hydrolases of the beta-lactamase superfamily III|uniref:Metallo-beta-lactamase domain-containing protein n=1 Tax=Candidatus Marsarchaeota G1 archaeon OSP_C TaxID=1978154 RepID=A0A2R6ANL1_9ARCH|nr:MAG: hypothetical protein B9Q00_07145 [Candidatus Marsarchaeota G1 archaeon OSP_C]